MKYSSVVGGKISRICILSAAASTFALASAAQAQTESADAAGFYSIEEVVVTAQRRAETAQETALSIIAISGDALKTAGINSPDDLTRIAPGVQVSGGTATQIYVRGIGDYGVTAQANPAIVTNIDGVVVSRPQAYSGNLYDIERIELLKGPQGTLYGRNASGGVLNVLTVQPKLGEFGGYLEGAVGNYSLRSAEGAINLPVAETAALRFAFQLNRRDGYLSDGSDDDNREAFRLQGRVEPNDRLNVSGSFSYTHLGGVGSGIAAIPVLPGLSPWTGTTDPVYATAFLAAAARGFAASGGTSVPPFLLDNPADYKLFRDVESYAANMQLNYDLPFATLTVIPAWRKTHARLSYNFNYNYNLGAPYNARGDEPDGERSTQYSLEARLANETEKVKWVIGAYWFKEDQDTDYQIRAGGTLNTRNILSLETEAYAAFAQLTYSVMDTVRLTGGLRYTSDMRRAYDFERYAISPMMLGRAPSAIDCTPPNGVPPGTVCPIYNRTPGFYDSEKTFDKLTWKVGVEIDIAPRSLLFADISRGFKAGGFNQSVTLVTRDSLLPFEPELVTAYTAGLKNRFFDNRLQVNFEAFYYDYNNMQMSSPGFDGDNSVVLITQNIEGATIKGASVDVVATPWRGGTLRGAVEYVDGQYDGFRVQQPAAFVPPGRVGCPVSPPNSVGVAVVDCSGFPLVRSPTWSGSFGATQIFELGSGGNITFNADATLVSENWISPDFHPNQLVPAYAVLSASLTYTAPEDRWAITAWVRNLTDEAVYVGGGGNQHGFVTGWTTSSIAPPRTYGLRFRAMF